MKPGTIAFATVFVAVFLWVNSARAYRSHQPLVFSKFAAEIASVFGEITPENVLVVVVTEAPDKKAFIVVIMKNSHRFKWASGPYETAINRIRAVIQKKNRQKSQSGKFDL